jgi:hypothetical protein
MACEPGRRYSCAVAVDLTRSARGALAGVAAAGLWAALQPLDKKVFGSAYDDVEMLGKAITRERGWYAAGLAFHLANGALFGATYAQIAPHLPVPPWARGPLTAVAENTALWPLVRLSDRFHPARDEMPALAGNRRALAQATWRHLVFGVALGELERILNREPEPEPSPEDFVSSNGYGRIEHAVAVEPS